MNPERTAVRCLGRSFLITLGAIVLAGLLGPVAMAQIGPSPFAYFPSGDVTDGRMLSFGCSNFQAFNPPISVNLAIPADQETYVLAVFDGEAGLMDGSGLEHWDSGDKQLLYSLYFDPLRQGSTDPADQIWQWTGNDPNPTANPVPDPDRTWTSDAAVMPDNDWWNLTVATSERARGRGADSEFFFYHLEIFPDPEATCTEFVSDLRLALSFPGTFELNRFGFEASLRQLPNDAEIIYPELQTPIPDPRFFLETPTTYDGTFEFVFEVEPGQVEVVIVEGDFDLGTDLLTATPSGVSLSFCEDTDDPDTDPAYANLPPGFDPEEALPEGFNSPGFPRDDNNLDIFRRGEPGNPDALGCVRYEVVDPNGRIFRNDNPSGNSEWERFRIATFLAAVPDDADYGPTVAADGATFVTEPVLPEGLWRVRIFGLDLGNVNQWILDGVCSQRSGAAACNPPSPLPPFYEIPTLSAAGQLVLVFFLAVAALLGLRRGCGSADHHL